VQVKVWGDYACFSRPEFKVERVSYPVITPSAARGVLEAIFWKPEFRYQIREIGVLKPGSQASILRNEISDRQGNNPLFVEEKRQQRASLILSDVEYLIRADIMLSPHISGPVYGYRDQFNRRLERGQYHHTPYLGTREFAAFFEHPGKNESPMPWDANLGLMLFDLAFIEDAHRRELEFVRHGPEGRRRVRGYTQALFFPAQVESGWLRVPAEKYQELYRVEGEDA